jgi:2-aminoethylphosphonate-pyruvate transaminase
MQKYIRINPGPVNIKESVRKALMAPDMCHREPEFSSLLLSCAKKLLRAFSVKGSYEAVFFTDSGTAELEAAVSSCVGPGRKILVVNNGVYGGRIAEIARRHNIGIVDLKSDIMRIPDMDSVEKRLKSDRSIAVVAMVHHETSTGILNPVYKAGALCRKYGKLFLLDSISALGGEDINLKKANVDLCVGTANKCIEAVPGVSFVLVSRTALAAVKGMRPRTLYFDIPSNLKSQKEGTPLFTPAVQIFFALERALDELIKEGVTRRINRYRQMAALLREGFETAGFEYLIDPEYHSNTITAFLVPRGITYEKLHRTFKLKGFIIYAGQSKLKGNIFRIANMGQISRSDANRIINIAKGLMKE